ncbi:MAG: 16S rRNA (uracil(1498)-N(3))-methyltransferase [Clostridia bacterium]|nr:16S rRNA (uracil(1498)-N(3))-methyltransferase [Clostridia bacterium]
MRRFFAEDISFDSGAVTLEGDEARHIKNVLRMKEGDKVLLINGEGSQFEAEITKLEEGSVFLRLIESSVCPADPDIRVTLFQCLPKQGKMEVIIQKCVELGVWKVVPVSSKRCVVKPDGKENKLVRWNKVSAEAAKQCGRAQIPKVESVSPLEKIDLNGFDLILIPYENEDEITLKQVLRDFGPLRDIAVIIGPEGGFDPSEVASVIERGGRAVSLGRRILRTETAGMAALAQIMYELEQ